MRRVSMLLLSLSLLSGGCVAEEEETPGLGDEKQKLSYSVGYQVGGDFRRQGLQIDPELVVKGVLDALADTEPLMTPAEMQRTLTELKQQAAATARQQREERTHENLADK